MEKAGYAEKYQNQTRGLTQPTNTADTQASNITSEVIKRTDLVKIKKSSKKAKWVCEQPAGLDPKVWNSLVKRLKKADPKLSSYGSMNAVCASDKSHAPLFRAAHIFARLALVLPPELAQRLAAPGCGETFWERLSNMGSHFDPDKEKI